MPIRFRCSYCSKLLGIARRKAGTDTVCPHCGYEITVPKEEGEKESDGGDSGRTAPPALESKPLLPATAEKPATVAKQANPEAPAATVEPPATIPDTDPPLFEKNLEEVLGALPAPPATSWAEKPKPRESSGMDAVSLGGASGPVVLSPQKATILVVGVVLLLAFAFAAGFLIASR
jgi:DNA-directed RNA polymerase subunit RPC12/RpoP